MTTVFTPQTNLDWVVQSAYINTAPTTAGLVAWPPRGPADGFMLFGPHDVGQSTNYTAALYALRGLLASVTTPNTVVAFLSDGLPTVTVAGQPMGTVLSTLPTANLTSECIVRPGGWSEPQRQPRADLGALRQALSGAHERIGRDRSRARHRRV
jgi:hypothetical protein